MLKVNVQQYKCFIVHICFICTFIFFPQVIYSASFNPFDGVGLLPRMQADKVLKERWNQLDKTINEIDDLSQDMFSVIGNIKEAYLESKIPCAGLVAIVASSYLFERTSIILEYERRSLVSLMLTTDDIDYFENKVDSYIGGVDYGIYRLKIIFEQLKGWYPTMESKAALHTIDKLKKIITDTIAMINSNVEILKKAKEGYYNDIDDAVEIKKMLDEENKESKEK